MSDRPATATGPVTPSPGASRGALAGAMFLMATSAIGPGFITQTTLFTADLGAAFAFAIVVSILVDIGIQLNVWRVIGVSGLRAQDLANKVFPGAGYALAALIVFGGLVFNIGNIGGTGLGTDAMFGLDPKAGGMISAAIATVVFLSRWAGIAVDRIVIVLGAVMIGMTSYVAIDSGPPVGDALKQSVAPDEVKYLVIATLIGGTVGGYITYAGAHRLVDSGVTGPENVRRISRSSVTGILVTGLMRVLLFLAVLGVVAGGVTLAKGNPPASAFEHATGSAGLRIFGVILWAASITSVIGASYTSVSFLTTLSDRLERWRKPLVVVFIATSAITYLIIGKTPVNLLILAGALNGLILPFGVAILLWVAMRRSQDLLGGYRYPRGLLVIGFLAWAFSLYVGWESLNDLPELWKD